VLSDGEADELLRALAHPARREIIRRCWHGPVAAGDLTEAVGLAAASTSEHLKVLRRTGLLVLTKEGTYRRYQVDRTRLTRLARWLAAFPDDMPSVHPTNGPGAGPPGSSSRRR
jgi:DNA-binding transcriptional ArsR family regulator